MVITKKLSKFMQMSIDYLLKNPEIFLENLVKGDSNTLKMFFSIAEIYIDIEKSQQGKEVPRRRRLKPEELKSVLKSTDDLFSAYSEKVK